MKKVLLTFLTIFCLVFNGFSQGKTENIILITFDGLRWQEVFGGAERRLLTHSQFVKDTAAALNMYWASSPEVRREKLLPFFWNVIAKQGQLYGNRAHNNYVNVTNNMWFSYPGYNEILTGFADDEQIKSNDAINNPNTTILEFLNTQKKFNNHVAAFTSWETFPWIINSTRSGIPVNAGYMRQNNMPNEREKLMNEIMFQLPNESGGTRLDAFTFHYAFEYLKKNKPKVLFISFDETDHFAHAGEYDKYLNSAKVTDNLLQQLWQWIQSTPEYKDKTTLIITTDHGRGQQQMEDWKHHGRKMENADEIWFAFMGPDTPALGEVKTAQQLYQNQVAATLAALLGVEYKNVKKTGDIILPVIRK
ncbi:MAG: alkaline phosphatase family protein [Cyclobacteriaceae bacterium]|nr:alkaline phosphatase family protein [Cyclobacteriaceae bacterium]